MNNWTSAFTVISIFALLVFGLVSCQRQENEFILKKQQLDNQVQIEKIKNGIYDKK